MITSSEPRPTVLREERRGFDGQRLATSRWPVANAASTLMFLHGFGQTRQAWGTTAERLARAGYSGLALDARGHGESEWNPPERRYSMQQFMADATGAAREQPGKPVLIGASLGGLVGLMSEAESDDGLYSALVLVDITPRWETKGVERILDFMGAHPDGFVDFEHAADAIASYLPHRRQRRSPADLSSLLVRRPDGRWRWHWDPRMIDEFAREGERHQDVLEAAARRIRVPTLLISGGMSDLVSDATVDEFLALVPQAEHVRIADATHMVAGDRNDAFTDAILNFCAALPRRSPRSVI